MKAILSIFIIIAAINLNAQEKKQGVEGMNYTKEAYKKDGNILYNTHSIIVDSVEIKIGDTLYFSFGSNTDKSFSFAMPQATYWTLDQKTMRYSTLPPSYSNTAVILKKIKPTYYFKQKISDGVFTLVGSKKIIYVDLYNAILSGEVKRPKNLHVDFSKITVIQ